MKRILKPQIRDLHTWRDVNGWKKDDG